MPIPLNEPLPTTKDFGVVAPRLPMASVNLMLPSVEMLYSRWPGPKSLAMYRSGRPSPVRSAVPAASVQPVASAYGMASGTFW
jgi:hypothetical protein